MVEDRIRKIEECVRGSGTMPDGAKGELLGLLGELRAELQGVKKEHLEAAEEAGGKAHDDALGGLTGTVAELEAMHPRLAEIVNRVAVALGNMGI